MNDWFIRMGPVAWPLLLCSLAVVALIVERALFFSRLGSLQRAEPDRLARLALERDWAGIARQLVAARGITGEGLRLWLAHRATEASARQEVLSVWLATQSRRLLAPLGWLGLCAAASPMLGLLGTVFGMIEAFRALAAHSGPTHPALLADGLWEAMLTTAAGLCVAIPALVFSHSLRIWGGSHLQRLQETLNRLELALAGVAGSPAEEPIEASSTLLAESAS